MASVFFWLIIFLSGLLLVGLTLLSAVRTLVLPRTAPDPIVRIVFRFVRWLLEIPLRFAKTYQARDRILAFYAPLSLISLLPLWYLLVAIGYTLMFRAAGVETWYQSFRDSGSSLLTLGFEPVNLFLHSLLAFTEAMIGLLLVALLLAYLPTIYSAFSRREAAVTLLEVRAGDPPSAVEMLKRFHRIHGLSQLGEVWQRWEEWFADIEESHTSLAALVFFRSPQPNHSWITAAGAVLDCASLTLSAVDVPYDPRAALCIRGGYLALRRIADYFEIQYESEPHPGDPISICKDDFDAALLELETEGVPLLSDREQAWRDFSGWRVNYDTTLLSLAEITMAPKGIWTSEPVNR
jgi:hypothetical protein